MFLPWGGTSPPPKKKERGVVTQIIIIGGLLYVGTKAIWTMFEIWVAFLAAQSSSRSLVVGWSVCPSILDLCEKVTFRLWNGYWHLPKAYLPTYLCDSSDSSDSSDHQTFFTNLWQIKNLNCDNSKPQIVTKHKLNLWQSKNFNCYQTQIARKLKILKLRQN